MGKCVDAQQDAFAEPTPERLDGLGAGCFVQFYHDGRCDWVEITETQGDELIATTHPELSEGDAKTQTMRPCEKLCLRKEQITALGCDRYCFC